MNDAVRTARACVVGGGITGLAAHHHLRERGVDSVVVEASSEPGGVIDTREVDGRIVEWGPQRTRLTPAVDELVRAVGLSALVVEAPDLPLLVYHDGDLHRAPLSPRAALATDLLSWRGKLRVLLEPLAGPPRPDETVGAYLRRAFGREAADRFLAPLYAGLYASDPDEMPARHSIARALDHAGVERSVLARAARAVVRGRERPPVISFEDGLQALPRALAAAHDRVRLDEPVRSIRRVDGNGDQVGGVEGFVVETDREVLHADHVVVTTPAGVAADLLSAVDPGSAAALERLRYNPLATVALRSPVDLSAAGYRVADDGLRTSGVTANAALLDRDGVYTCYLGGATDPGVLDWSDDRIGSVAAREFRRATGADAEVLSVHRVRPGMPAYDRSFDALGDVDPPAGIHLAANYRARAGIPGRVRQARGVAERIAAGDDGTGPADAGPRKRRADRAT